MPYALQRGDIDTDGGRLAPLALRREQEVASRREQPALRREQEAALRREQPASRREREAALRREQEDASKQRSELYTPEQRIRRDRSPWTLVQGILAPVQFAIFLISLALVLHYLATGTGYAWAAGSIVVKTLALYTIMITGAIWEREVFGVYLFAKPFFWEDVFSMLVIALHTAYLWALAAGALAPEALMILALSAYATYVINAAQFILKLRAARLGRAAAMQAAGAPA